MYVLKKYYGAKPTLIKKKIVITVLFALLLVFMYYIKKLLHFKKTELLCKTYYREL